MICPFCAIQMHQDVKDGNFRGGGNSSDKDYWTWEIKVCPQCNRKVKEFYSVEVLEEDEKNNIGENQGGQNPDPAIL